jgi:hypothetical protein
LGIWEFGDWGKQKSNILFLLTFFFINIRIENFNNKNFNFQ